MRKIDKSTATQPENLKRETPRFTERVESAIAEKNLKGNERKFLGYDDAYDELFKLYHGRCAYCESPIKSVATPQVEHYRPKKMVVGNTQHKGYYWLAWEWTNLLLACPKCNQQGNKGNHFPIADTGTRCEEEPRTPTGELDYLAFDARNRTLQAEKPLLLHPEIDNPAEHLICLPNGEMQGLTQRGRITIEICDLNRKGLIRDRKEILDNIVRELERIIEFALTPTNAAQKKIIKTNLREIFDSIFRYNTETTAFTFYHDCIKNNMEKLLIGKMPPNIQSGVRSALTQYLRNEL